MNLRWLFFIILWCLTAGCSENEPAVRVDLNKTEQVIFREESAVITYAYLPQYSHTVSYTRHHGLIQHLRQATGLNIRQVFPNTFDQHMEMVGQKKIDISFSNPFIYVKIAHRHGAKAFARIVEASGADKFRGQVITRHDNGGINSLKDCRGRRWIAVDSTSAGGYLFPLGLFYQNGIRESDFQEIAFAPGPGGKQEKVIHAVFSGKFDIGTIREGALDVVAGKIDVRQIRILARTRAYPGWVYAANKDMNPDHLFKIRQALVSLDFNQNHHREILEAAEFIRVIPADDADFKAVRELTSRLSLGLNQ